MQVDRQRVHGFAEELFRRSAGITSAVLRYHVLVEWVSCPERRALALSQLSHLTIPRNAVEVVPAISPTGATTAVHDLCMLSRGCTEL